jgi:hypothetical protein
MDTLNTVRVVVKLQSPEQAPEYLTFGWALFNRPCPEAGDEIAFGDYLLIVRNRRYQVPEFLEAPSITLHTGLTGRHSRSPVSRAELLEVLQKYRLSIEILG